MYNIGSSIAAIMNTQLCIVRGTTNSRKCARSIVIQAEAFAVIGECRLNIGGLEPKGFQRIWIAAIAVGLVGGVIQPGTHALLCCGAVGQTTALINAFQRGYRILGQFPKRRCTMRGSSTVTDEAGSCLP